MAENDSWAILGQIAGPVALLLAIYGAWRKTGEPDEQRHRKTEEIVNALANRMGIAEDRLVTVRESLKEIKRDMEPLDRINNQLATLLSYFANTRPSRRETPAPRRETD